MFTFESQRAVAE